MAVETRPELVGKRFLCVAVGDEARPERGESGRCWRSWRAGVIRAVSHRDSRNPDLAVSERLPASESRCLSLSTWAAPGSARTTGGHAPLWSPQSWPRRPARVSAHGEWLPRQRRCRSRTASEAASGSVRGRGSGRASRGCPLWRPGGRADLSGRRGRERWAAGGAGPSGAVGGQLPWHLSAGQSLCSAGACALKLSHKVAEGEAKLTDLLALQRCVCVCVCVEVRQWQWRCPDSPSTW